MNQPSAEELLKAGIGLDALDFVNMIRDQFYLTPKTESVPGAVDSTTLLEMARKREKELERKNFDKVSFQSGFIEGYTANIGTVARLMWELEIMRGADKDNEGLFKEIEKMQADIDKKIDTNLGLQCDIDRLKAEIDRLKVKCNTYAKRLVNDGADDVAWEITEGLFGNKKPEAVGCGKWQDCDMGKVACCSAYLCPDCKKANDSGKAKVVLPEVPKLPFIHNDFQEQSVNFMKAVKAHLEGKDE